MNANQAAPDRSRLAPPPKQDQELSPTVLETLLKIVLLHAMKEIPEILSMDPNSPELLKALQSHQHDLHKKLAANAGRKDTSSASAGQPTKQPPSGKRPFANEGNRTQRVARVLNGDTGDES